MKIEASLDVDEKLRTALEDLASTIGLHYPEAHFRISRGEDDPTIVQLVAIVNLDDTDAVHDVVMERVLELQEEGLPIFVVTERPLQRTVTMQEAAQTARAAYAVTS